METNCCGGAFSQNCATVHRKRLQGVQACARFRLASTAFASKNRLAKPISTNPWKKAPHIRLDGTGQRPAELELLECWVQIRHHGLKSVRIKPAPAWLVYVACKGCSCRFIGQPAPGCPGHVPAKHSALKTLTLRKSWPLGRFLIHQD